MTHRPDSSDPSEPLRRLPRFRASPEFTPRLISKLDEHQPRRGLWVAPRVLKLAAVTAVVVLGLWIGVTHRERHLEEQAYRERVDALRARYETLVTEVGDLRKEAAEAPAVVYLGGNDSFDLMVDLADLAAYPSARTPALTLPASYQQ